MKKTLFLCLFFSFDLLAQSLQEILKSIDENNKIKALEYRQDAQIAQTQASLSYEAPTISLDVGSAKESSGDEGKEYSLVFSQDIQTPFAFEEKKSVQDAMIRSLKTSTRYEQNSFALDISLYYHLVCMDKESLELLEYLVSEQKKGYEKLRVAYELGEISRKDLLFHQVEYLKLQEQKRIFENRYYHALAQLQSQVQNIKIDSLECRDAIVPSEENLVRESQTNAKLEALRYELDAANASYKLSESFLQSLSYSLSYAKELDKKRYGVVLSIPLSSFTSKQEQRQVEYLSTKTALNEELVALNYELEQNVKSLDTKLRASYRSLKSYEEEIVPLSKELQELSFLALLEGEGSVMESLAATRSFLENTLEMLKKKREYYEQLFAFYKITDKHLGEIK